MSSSNNKQSNGGRALVEKYGIDHMRHIGSNGGKATKKKYQLVPFGIGDFLMVNRMTGEINHKTLCGLDAPQEVNINV